MAPLTTASTLRNFRSNVERAFRSANPDAIQTGLVITWIESKRVTFPTGYKGFCGIIEVAAPGYRPTRRYPSWVEGEGLSV